MADLARAMQVAAEAARTDTLARLSQDVKAYIEAIHAQAATDATDLRKRADDDVVAIRDRSNAEIARIRDETEGRITQRKLALDGEIEDYDAAVEHRIEAVQASVATFKLEMAEFFAALLAETDPTRLAGMAEALPEPPVFDQPHPNDEVVGSLEVAEPVETPEPTQATDAIDTPEATFDDTPEATLDDTPEATFDVAAEATFDVAAEATFDVAAETHPAVDPRLAALGLAPEFAADEWEVAESNADENDSNDEVPIIGDDALAARLAALVPETEAPEAYESTRVVVVGLVSVPASRASSATWRVSRAFGRSEPRSACVR